MSFPRPATFDFGAQHSGPAAAQGGGSAIGAGGGRGIGKLGKRRNAHEIMRILFCGVCGAMKLGVCEAIILAMHA